MIKQFQTQLKRWKRRQYRRHLERLKLAARLQK